MQKEPLSIALELSKSTQCPNDHAPKDHACLILAVPQSLNLKMQDKKVCVNNSIVNILDISGLIRGEGVLWIFLSRDVPLGLWYAYPKLDHVELLFATLF